MKISRRKFFLGSVSLAAILRTSEAVGVFHGSFVSTFNNGRSQVQSWDLGLTTDCPFLNLMLTATPWKYNDNQGFPAPTELDANGYPLATGAHTGYKAIVDIFPSASGRTGGTYVLTWSGNGTMSLGVPNTGTITGTSGSLTSSGGSGRYEFTTTSPDAVVVGITNVSSPTITNIKLFYKADESLLNAGKIFGAQYLSTLRSGNPGVIRFLDWFPGNTTNMTTWATRKPVSYYSYNTYELRPSLYAGTATANGGVKYGLTFGSGGPVDKQTIHVNIPATNVSFSGATVTWGAGSPANHGFNVGQPIIFTGPWPATTIGGVSVIQYSNQGPTIYWVTSVPTSSTFTFSSTKGGANITPGAITGTPQAFAYATAQAVTYDNSGAADVITWTNHGLNIGDAISINSSASFGMPSPLHNQLTYYVIASGFTSNSFEFSLTKGGAAVATLNATKSGSFFAFGIPTFNLNSTGDVPILSQSGDQASDLGCPFGSTNTATLVYDADLGGWLKFGGDTGGTLGIDSRVPIEIMVELCKQVGAHPHFPAPFLACDPTTDWFTQLATYIKTSGPSWMKPRFEGTNETWNPTGGFYATRYAWNKSPSHWGLSYYLNDDHWYGMIVSKIGQAVNAVYGGTPSTQTKYALLCGIQTVTAGSNANDPRLTAAAWIAAGTPTQSGYTVSAAYNWASHVVVANYWSPGETDTPSEITDAYNYWVTNSGNATAQAALATSYIGTANTGCNFTGSLASGVLTVSAIAYGSLSIGAIIKNSGSTITTGTTITGQLTGPAGGLGTYSITGSQMIASGNILTDGAYNGSPASFANLLSVKRYAQFALAWAQGLGSGQVSKMCGYEGGYSPDYPSTGSNFLSAITNISQAANAVVTVGTYLNHNGNGTGNPAVIGMPVIIGNGNNPLVGMSQIYNWRDPVGVSLSDSGGVTNVTYTAHGFSSGQAVFFIAQSQFGSALPSGMIFSKAYYVATVVDPNNFTVSATSGGAAITFSGAQVGGVSLQPCWVVTAVSGNTMSLNVDSSAFTAYVSGGQISWGDIVGLLTQFRYAGKFSANLQTYTTQLYNDFVGLGGEFPSCYFLSGSTAVWAVWDPNIFVASTPPQWAAITAFNH